MESLPRIRARRRFVPGLDLSGHQQRVTKLLTQMRSELVETEGVQDFSDARIDTWWEIDKQEQVIELSVPASARPEDW